MSEPDPNSPPAEPKRLGRSFLIGSVQLGGANWLSYALNFGLTILIARLLGPADFGLYAFVAAINEVLNIVGAFSMSVALIQAREATQRLYDTAVAICGGLGAIGLVAAALVAPVLWLQHSPEAAQLLLALAIGRVLRLLSQVPQVHLERSLRYGPVAVISVVTGNLPNVAAVGLAWAGFGAWSLVLRDLLQAALLLGLSMLLSDYRFRAQVERGAYDQLMSVGKRLFVAISVGHVQERMDRVSIGAFLGDAATGLYQQARFLAESGFLAMRPISRLGLNLYARLQDDPVRLSRAFDLLNTVLMRVMCAGAVALFTFPEAVIRLLLGEAWLDAAPLLRMFGVFAVSYALIENTRVLFLGLGRIELNLRTAAFQASISIPGAVLAAWMGSLIGVAGAVVGASVAAYLLSWYMSRPLVQHRALPVFTVPLLLVASIVAAFTAADAAGWLAGIPWPALPFLPVVTYALCLGVIERTRLLNEFRYLRQQMSSPPAA